MQRPSYQASKLFTINRLKIGNRLIIIVVTYLGDFILNSCFENQAEGMQSLDR
jgi:hypothetical protein